MKPMKKKTAIPQIPKPIPIVKPAMESDLWTGESGINNPASHHRVIQAEEAQAQPAQATEATAIEAKPMVLSATSNWSRHFMHKTSLREKVRPRNPFKHYTYAKQSE
jgi:hypothetical protein